MANQILQDAIARLRATNQIAKANGVAPGAGYREIQTSLPKNLTPNIGNQTTASGKQATQNYVDYYNSQNQNNQQQTYGGGGFSTPSFNYTQPPIINYDQARKQVEDEIDPMYQRALENLQKTKYQNELNAGAIAANRGIARSGLAADAMNKIGIATQGQQSDMEAQRASLIAQMATALVNREQDRADRLRQMALQEWMAQQGMMFDRERFEYGKGRDTINDQYRWGDMFDQWNAPLPDWYRSYNGYRY